jgi:Zn-dependent alcohol dehydrogenase
VRLPSPPAARRRLPHPAEAGSAFHFDTSNGRTITVRQLGVIGDNVIPGSAVADEAKPIALDRWLADAGAITAKTPGAGDGGRRCDFRYVVDNMVEGCKHARARAAPASSQR